MATVRVSGGDMGSEEILVRCDLRNASATVEVDYRNGEGWQPTQYQCADCRHTVDGLEAIARSIAASAVEIPLQRFTATVSE